MHNTTSQFAFLINVDHTYEPGTVVAELSRGYTWGDEVIRPARVHVAQ